MIGTWKGKYKYNLKYNSKFNNKEVEFTIKINEFDGEKFIGTVEDHNEDYGTRGVGKIEGKLKDGTIEFTKLMPVKSIALNNGKEKMEFENEKHYPIYYLGIFTSTNSFTGKWKIKGGIAFRNKQLQISFGTKGSWEMVKIG